MIYRPLYDTIQNLLIRCLPVKAKTTLNFILALLTADTETGNLKLFARNMLRVSGCLMTMCDLFTSGMMVRISTNLKCHLYTYIQSDVSLAP